MKFKKLHSGQLSSLYMILTMICFVCTFVLGAIKMYHLLFVFATVTIVCAIFTFMYTKLAQDITLYFGAKEENKKSFDILAQVVDQLLKGMTEVAILRKAEPEPVSKKKTIKDKSLGVQVNVEVKKGEVNAKPKKRGRPKKEN